MPLASFDVVYRTYIKLVELQSHVPSGPNFKDFPHQPVKLLEAYSLAWKAIKDKELIYTSEWQRQEGASTTAMALAMTTDNATMLVSDMARAKDTTRKILQTFQKESGKLHPHLQPNVVHLNVWWMTGVRHCVHSRQPELVIVDSETAWRRDRDQSIDELRNFLKSGVLVLDAPTPSFFL